MGRGDFGQRLRAAEEIDRLLGAAVHRVEHLQLLHAEVVVGAHLGEHFFDRARRGVASGLVEVHGGRDVRQHVDRVLRRRVHLLGVRPLELDLVEALRADGEVAGERAVRLLRERHRVVLVQQHPAAGRRHRRRDLQADFGALDRGDVAARIDRARLQSGVGGEAVLEHELVHGRQVEDVHREARRFDAVRHDEVLRRLLDVEQHPLERRRIGGRHERHALELAGGSMRTISVASGRRSPGASP